MNLAPIVLFTYNRPLHTKQTIEALQANTLAQESDLFIYSDAPKNPEAKEAVESVLNYLHTVSGFRTVKIIEREHNWGLADSIIDGVSKVVNDYGKVIVLEDDIVTSVYFLEYMNNALELYKDENKVMHISGYFFPVDPTSLPETFFYNQTSCWGWGTWARAWEKIDTDVESLLNKLSRVKNNHQYFKSCRSQLKANQRGLINTWGARWQASVLLNDGYCLHPAVSFVTNIGHDGSGVNSTDNLILSKVNSLPTQKLVLKPAPILENLVALEKADAFYKTFKPTLAARIFGLLRNAFRN